MHAVDLGITSRLLSMWLNPQNRDKPFYFNQEKKNRMDEFISKLKPPKEIPRSFRRLAEMSNYKASEYSSLLLYVFPLILRELLPTSHYQHFLLLVITMKNLLSSPITPVSLEHSKILAYKFVEIMPTLYGPKSIIHNVHLFTHLTDVVQNIGSLSDVTAYPYEAANGIFRDYVCGTKNIAKEMARKFELSFACHLNISSIPPPVQKLGTRTAIQSSTLQIIEDSGSGISTAFQFSTYRKNEKFYSSKSYTVEKDSCNAFIQINDSLYFHAHCYIEKKEEIYAIGRAYDKVSNPLYCDVNGYRMALDHIVQVQKGAIIMMNVNQFRAKCLFVEHNNETFIVQILNTFAY